MIFVTELSFYLFLWVTLVTALPSRIYDEPDFSDIMADSTIDTIKTLMDKGITQYAKFATWGYSGDRREEAKQNITRSFAVFEVQFLKDVRPLVKEDCAVIIKDLESRNETLGSYDIARLAGHVTADVAQVLGRDMGKWTDVKGPAMIAAVTAAVLGGIDVIVKGLEKVKDQIKSISSSE